MKKQMIAFGVAFLVGFIAVLAMASTAEASRRHHRGRSVTRTFRPVVSAAPVMDCSGGTCRLRVK